MRKVSRKKQRHRRNKHRISTLNENIETGNKERKCIQDEENLRTVIMK